MDDFLRVISKHRAAERRYMTEIVKHQHMPATQRFYAQELQAVRVALKREMQLLSAMNQSVVQKELDFAESIAADRLNAGRAKTSSSRKELVRRHIEDNITTQSDAHHDTIDETNGCDLEDQSSIQRLIDETMDQLASEYNISRSVAVSMSKLGDAMQAPSGFASGMPAAPAAPAAEPSGKKKQEEKSTKQHEQVSYLDSL